MHDPVVRILVVVGAGIVWLAGLRLFLQSDLSQTKKLGWASFLCLVGICMAVVLPHSQLWGKFLLLIFMLPALGFADVFLLRSHRGLAFWIRACGFEICTVFGAAATARFLLDVAGVAALLPAVN